MATLEARFTAGDMELFRQVAERTLPEPAQDPGAAESQDTARWARSLSCIPRHRAANATAGVPYTHN